MGRLSGLSATLFACVTACGDDGVHHLPDGPAAIDGSVDAPVVPPADTTVTTLALCCDVAQGTPIAAVPVFVVKPDGTLGTGGMTGADGKLTLHGVVPGSAITAVYPETINHDTYLSSMLAVKPGDNLTFGDGYYTISAGGTAGAMTVSVAPLVDAAHYYIETACGGTTYDVPVPAVPVTANIDISVPQYDYCQTATTPLSVIATDTNGTVIDSAYFPTAAFTNGAVVTVSTWTANTANNFTTSISGLIPEVTNTYLGAYAVSPTGQQGAAGYQPIISGAASRTVTVPTTLPRTYGYAQLDRNNLGHQFAYKAGAGTATTIALTEPTLPWLDATNSSPDYNVLLNPVIGKASWLQTDGSYDAAVLHVQWNRTDVSSTTHTYHWTLIVPPGQTELDFGHVPTELASYVPTSTDQLQQHGVRLIDLSSAANYDALRQLPEWQMVDPDLAVTRGDQPAADYSGGEGACCGGPVLKRGKPAKHATLHR